MQVLTLILESVSNMLLICGGSVFLICVDNL